MKRSVLRIGCAVLSLSAAAGLLASCSLLPPASPLPDSKPAQAEEVPGPAAASLDDGKLRILYSNGSNGGNTVLCGNTVLYQAASSETVYLVPDTLTGTVRYYLRQWSAPGTPTGRATALCDRSGKEILTFDRAYDAVLTGSLLVLTAPEQMAYSPALHHAAGDCRVLDLATGEELTVPENAYGCRIAGETLAFNLCNAPAQALDENTWGDDLTRYYALQIQDRDGNRIRQEPLCAAVSLSYSYNEISSPADWLELDYYSEDEDMVIDHISLYSTATGEELTGFQQYTGAGTVSLYNSGRYQLVDLASTEQSAVLCEFDEPVRYYLPGAAITEPEASGRYLFHDLLTGEEKELYDVGTDDATLAIYALDGTVRVFDRQTGVLLTDTAIDPVENQVRAHVYAENGWVWVAQDDNDNYVNTAIQICGPDGTHKTLDPRTLEEAYTHYYPLFSTADGLYFYGCCNGPGGSWLYDILDSDGNVVVGGLRSCSTYYADSANGLPEGVFAASKGFSYGWMDLSGRWLYAESIFASTADEMDNYYF
uniref:DUF5046 domain-containing protein n=1 Tax=Faecalibacterium sp. TaxID=1971605 RepID=UPI004027702E